MKTFIIEPEVAGQLGPKTVVDTNSHPPVISKLNYEFDGWSGDDILESFPAFIVSERLRGALAVSGFLGFSFDAVLISKSETFSDSQAADLEIPNFHWLKVDGKDHSDDFQVNDDHLLVVTERALDLLRKFGLNHCDIEEV